MKTPVSVAVAVIALSACQRDHDGDRASGTTTTSSIPVVVQPAWRTAGTPVATANGFDIVYASSGRCGRFDHADVSETQKTVTVTVYVKDSLRARKPPAGCESVLSTDRAHVGLKGPLGNRAIAGMCDVDAANAKPEDTRTVSDRACLFVADHAR